REALDVTPLPLGIKSIKSKRALARAGNPGQADQPAPGQGERDVAQVVLARPPNHDVRCGHPWMVPFYIGPSIGSQRRDSIHLSSIAVHQNRGAVVTTGTQGRAAGIRGGDGRYPSCPQGQLSATRSGRCRSAWPVLPYSRSRPLLCTPNGTEGAARIIRMTA